MMATISETDARLNTHEAVCAERYKGIQDQFDGANARLKRLEKILIGSVGFIIALLLSLVLKM
jgi:hypothetical protein